MRRIHSILVIAFLLLAVEEGNSQPKYADVPFWQDSAEKLPLPDGLSSATLMQVRADRNGVIKVLSSDGLLQPYKGHLARDFSYRPLSDMNLLRLELRRSQFVFLTGKAVFSNAWAGTFDVTHGVEGVSRFAVGDDESVLVAGNGKLAYLENEEQVWQTSEKDLRPVELSFNFARGHFLILTPKFLASFDPASKTLSRHYEEEGLTCMTLLDEGSEIVLGTKDGYLRLDAATFRPQTGLIKKLPWPEITCVQEIRGRLWFGSTHGAFALREDGRYDYCASKRWLVDDHVVDIAEGPDESVLILTRKGLSRIHFEKMTLAEKARRLQKIQRLRHVRYGLNSEMNLKVPGDLSSGILIDTDNDGLWTSMYLAGELFRYAVTKSDDALRNAYEAFEGMERLDLINHLDGFPSRTYERDGYEWSDVKRKVSEDRRIWRRTEDGKWRWKSTTSSDESCGHFFVYALFAEIVPDEAWKQRAVTQITRQMDHIIDHDWYLVSWDGRPTKWGRWNPEYVNSFPVQVGDRRLNSTLILAFLQTAYHFSGKEVYKEKAYELIEKHGYLENALRPASKIGFVEGEELSDSWNHSDDEMYFLTVPALVKYAFTAEMREKYRETVKSQWEVERSEGSPLWNFLYAIAGGQDYDLEASVDWLREFPLDLIGWTVRNSHRRDVELLEPNFRSQTTSEILPPDERPLHLHNGPTYIIDGGSGGRREYPGYIYLLPYWAGRYVGAIGPEEE